MSGNKKKDQEKPGGFGSFGSLLSKHLGVAEPEDAKSGGFGGKADIGGDGKLVYSTDATLREKCERCHELKAACTCLKAEKVGAFMPVLRLEKKGRGGKTVTVIAGFPKNESFLKEWTTKLKKKCGTGGTYVLESGEIEIQGDHRDSLRAHFTAEELRPKG